MNEIIPNSYSKSKNKSVAHTKSLDTQSKTIHEYNIYTTVHRRFVISEPTIRKLCVLLGFIFGIIFHTIYIQNFDFISKINNIKSILFNFTPFAQEIMNNTNFKYVFIIGVVLTLLASIAFFCINFIEFENKHIFILLLMTLFFSFIYLYLNFAICHLIIKIPIYFKILSTIAIIVSNIIFFFIIIVIEALIFETITSN